MKRFVLFISILFLAVTTLFAKEKKMYVTVKNASVKSGTGFFSEELFSLSYGDSVLLIEEKDSLSKVRNGKCQEGWVSSASLSKRKIAKSGFSASADELALAGKGFSAELENSFKKEKKADYASVNKMESRNVDLNELKQFIKDGGLEGADE